MTPMATHARTPDAPERPALIPGYIAASTHQRLLGRLTEAGLVLAVLVVPYLLALVFANGAAAFSLLILLFVPAALVVLGIVVPLRTSAPAGYAAVGLRFLDVETGQLAGGKVLAKYLLESAVPFGAIVALATMDENHRNWYDRVLGVQLVHWEPSRLGYGRVDVPARRGPAAAPIPTAKAQTPTAETPLAPSTAPGLTMPAPPSIPPPGQSDSDAGSVTTMTAPASERPGPRVEDAEVGPPLSSGPQPTPLLPCRHTVELDNGDTIDLAAPILLGRDPSSSAAVPQGRPHPVLDLARSISKTHLAVGADGHEAWAMDLRSTNGSSIGRGGVVTPLVAWVRTPLAEGDVVRFGDRTLTLHTTAARPTHE